MGKEIVYCVDCGEKITEDAFERGRAQTLEGRPYCSRCRPITAPPPPPPSRERATERRATERRTASTKHRRPATERIGRVAPPPAPAAPSRTPWVVGGGVAIGVSVLALVAVMGTKKDPGPEPAAISRPDARPQAREDLEDRLRELESLAAVTSDPQAVLLRCDQLRPSFRGTPQEPRFKQVEFRALERLQEKERSAELDRSIASIRKMMQEDPDCTRRVEVELLLEAALKKAGPRSGDVQKLQGEYRTQCEDAARRLEAKKKPAPRPWGECFTLATNRITANDYPGAKTLYLEGLATLPETRPEELAPRLLYAAGLYNLCCIYSVEMAKLTDAARATALDNALKYLDWALRSDYGRFRCPCHNQTGGYGHMADDKDLEALRPETRYVELLKKYKQ